MLFFFCNGLLDYPLYLLTILLSVWWWIFLKRFFACGGVLVMVCFFACLQINGVTGESFSFPQVRDLIWRVASGLARHGVGKGDVVMILSENCVEYIIAFHAIISLGGTVTMANPQYLPGKTRYPQRFFEVEMKWWRSSDWLTDRFGDLPANRLSSATRYSRWKT